MKVGYDRHRFHSYENNAETRKITDRQWQNFRHIQCVPRSICLVWLWRERER